MLLDTVRTWARRIVRAILLSMIIVTRTAIRTVSMARTVIRTFVEIIIVTTVFADSVTFAPA